MSASAGVPGVRALTAWLRGQVGGALVRSVPSDASLFQLVDAIDQSVWDEERLQEEVATWIGSHAIGRSPALEVLVRHCPSRLIVTLNYDLSVETTARRLNIPVNPLSCSPDDLAEVHQLLRRDPRASNPLTVLHLHGTVGDSHSIVLGSRSYEDHSRDPNVADILHGLVYYRTLLFLGTSLNEEYFVADLQHCRNPGPHVLITTPGGLTEITTGRLALSPERHGLWLETIPDHPALPATLRSVLQPATAPATAPAPAIARPITANASYVENEFVDQATPVDEMDLIRAELGLTPNAPIPDPVTEEDLAVWYRTLVLGAAGSGKTELLLELANKSRPDRPGVVIRLADVHVGSGDPARLLARWARNGYTTHSDLDISLEAIRERPLHFLLDGLDEVPSAQQRDVARVIRAVAEQLSQHAFTVTARPGSAAAALGGGTEDWRVVHAAPGHAWQRRYLELQGVTLAELEAEMPALTDMGSLLTSPFFLSRTVQLHDADRLRGLRDIGELLGALIDRALDREEPILELEAGAVRRWLRSVALAGALAGRRSFSAEELRQLDTPDGIGNPQELAEILVQRLLLAEDDGNYRFSHRILGEALAAEALVEHGPLEPLLDCLVPAPTAEIAAVREDARLIVGLACLASPDWRGAVATRDRLAALRATPTDAPVAERREAIAGMWSIHSARGVWMWEYGTPTLVDDTEALARLMRSDPDGEPTKAIQRAVHAGSPQDQGNAIRVLALIAPHGFEGDLRLVLNDPDRNGVVHRQAAIAAERCSFTGLVDAIVDLLERTQDDVVRQDAGMALAELVPDERRHEVLAQIARFAGGRYVFERLFSRLTPEQRVLVAAEGSGGGDLSLTSSSRTALDDAIRGLASGDGADPRLVTALGRLGTQGVIDLKAVQRLLTSNPEAAIDGIRAALDDGAGWWDALGIGMVMGHDRLRAAGLPEELVERVDNMERQAAERERSGTTETARAGADPPAMAASGDAPVADAELTLAELLALPPEESDSAIAYWGSAEPGKAADLSDEEKAELVRRLERWGSAASQAWLGFGSALDLDLSTELWAELATHSLHTEQHTEWLVSRCTTEGITRGTQLLTGVGEPERWGQLLASCPDPVPREVLTACVAAVDGSTRPPHDYAHRYGMELIATRMLASDAVQLAHQLAERDERFHAVLVVQLARAGDVAAQEALLDNVIRRLDAGDRPDRDSLTWSGAISDVRLLPRLFEILGSTWRTSDEPTPRISSVSNAHDVVSPIIAAIASIEGQATVEHYDALIARGGGYRWLADARANVAREYLRSTGTAAAGPAADAANVPRVDMDPGEE